MEANACDSESFHPDSLSVLYSGSSNSSPADTNESHGTHAGQTIYIPVREDGSDPACMVYHYELHL